MEAHDPTSRSLTWTVLLARWTDFARSAVALPKTGEAGHYRESVAPLISLHAVTHALGEVHLLDEDERALAIDRAEILIRREFETLERIWSKKNQIPDALAVFVNDAAEAISYFAPDQVCLEWVVESDHTVFAHPGELLAAIESTGIEMDLYVPSPGVPFFTGAVAACACFSGATGEIEAVADVIGSFLGDGVGEAMPASELRQVYRQFDFALGGPVRDLVVPISAGDVPGQPLLVCGLVGGEARPVSLPPRSAIRIDALPVVDASSA